MLCCILPHASGPNAALARQSELAIGAGLAVVAALLPALPVPLLYSVAGSSRAEETAQGGSMVAGTGGGDAAASGFGGQPGQSTTRRREDPHDVGRDNAPFGSGRRMQVQMRIWSGAGLIHARHRASLRPLITHMHTLPCALTHR